MANVNFLNAMVSGSDWAFALRSRGWTAAQASLMLDALRLPVATADIVRWCAPNLKDEDKTLARATLWALLSRVDAGTWGASKYFQPSEFGVWYGWMHPALVCALDILRERLGAPVEISPANGALGRYLTKEKSLHNVCRYGFVMAADVLVPVGHDLATVRREAIDLKIFGGIGCYPDWKPRAGLHLDIRHLVPSAHGLKGDPITPATWGAWRNSQGVQVYGTADEALDHGTRSA